MCSVLVRTCSAGLRWARASASSPVRARNVPTRRRRVDCLPTPVQPAGDRRDFGAQQDHADGARQALGPQRRRLGAERRLPGGSREGWCGSADHRQPRRPSDLDHRLPARGLGVSAGSARRRPSADVCRARARRSDLRPAEPLRPQCDERLRGRLPGSLGPVGGEVAGLRGDAEGDGARGHPRSGRVVGPLRRAHARGRLRRHGGAHLAQLPPASVPVAALQQARGRVRRVVREPAPLRAAR